MRSLFVLVGTCAAIREPYVVLRTLGDKMRIQFKELLVKNPKLEQTKNYGWYPWSTKMAEFCKEGEDDAFYATTHYVGNKSFIRDYLMHCCKVDPGKIANAVKAFNELTWVHFDLLTRGDDDINPTWREREKVTAKWGEIENMRQTKVDQ